MWYSDILYLVRITATFNVFIKNNNLSCISTTIHVHFTYLSNKLRGWLGGDMVWRWFVLWSCRHSVTMITKAFWHFIILKLPQSHYVASRLGCTSQLLVCGAPQLEKMTLYIYIKSSTPVAGSCKRRKLKALANCLPSEACDEFENTSRMT